MLNFAIRSLCCGDKLFDKIIFMSIKDFDAYLWDVDGTLIRSIPLIKHCFELTGAHFAHIFGCQPPPDSLLDQNIGKSLRDQIDLYFSPPAELFDSVLLYYQETQREHYADYLELFEGVREVLTELRQRGKKLAVVTNRTEPTLSRYLDHFDLSGVFDVIICPTDTIPGKPDPHMIHEVLRTLNVDAKRACMVGDTVFDILAAKNAGVFPLLVRWAELDFAGAEADAGAVLERMHDLLE